MNGAYKAFKNFEKLLEDLPKALQRLFNSLEKGLKIPFRGLQKPIKDPLTLIASAQITWKRDKSPRNIRILRGAPKPPRKPQGHQELPEARKVS